MNSRHRLLEISWRRFYFSDKVFVEDKCIKGPTLLRSKCPQDFFFCDLSSVCTLMPYYRPFERNNKPRSILVLLERSCGAKYSATRSIHLPQEHTKSGGASFGDTKPNLWSFLSSRLLSFVRIVLVLQRKNCSTIHEPCLSCTTSEN